jgi:2-polyprenyl-6-hydroxyphenyl methylase/3-demethylubiquinone-9 3-methyltransferase
MSQSTQALPLSQPFLFQKALRENDCQARGTQLFAAGRYEEAVALFHQALTQGGGTADLWNDWAMANMFAGNQPQAEQGFRLALTLGEQNFEPATNLAVLLARLGRYHEAVALLEQWLPKFPENRRAAGKQLLEACRQNRAVETELPPTVAAASAARQAPLVQTVATVAAPLPAPPASAPAPQPSREAIPTVAPDELAKALENENQLFVQREFLDYRESFENWSAAGFLPRAAVTGKRVWDLECGNCAYSGVLATHGAACVLGSDTFLQAKHIAGSIRNLPNFQFEHGTLREVHKRTEFHPDLILFHNSSEHVKDLPELLCDCAQVLRPGGLLFLAHHNYYQPSGHHDQGFLRFDPKTNKIDFCGVKCWESERKCQSSEAHRQGLMNPDPHAVSLWDQSLEGRLTPQDCSQCAYFKRSRPWAHLLYQHEFNTLFPHRFFRTAGGSLNKVTLFQLRQFLREAGFECVREDSIMLNNEIPAELARRISEEDLRAYQLIALYRKQG